MNKRKVLSLQVLFEDGEVVHFNKLQATFSESPNCRTAGNGSPKKIAEWTEYHITWLSDVKSDAVEESIQDKIEHRKEEAWCSQHQMNPSDCYKIHNPTAYSGRHQQWEDTKAIQEKSLPKIFQKKEIPPYLDFGLDGWIGETNGHHT